MDSSSAHQRAFSANEALRLYVDGGFTKDQYNGVRALLADRVGNIFPSFHAIRSARRKCYHCEELRVTDFAAEVSLQSLVNHTAERLLEALQDSVQQSLSTNLTLIFKWGCNSSSTDLKNMLERGENNTENIEEHIFVICIVPLELNDSGNTVWKNPRTSSIRYCRPLKLIFQQQSKEQIKLEIERIKNQISAIESTAINCKDKQVLVKPKLYLALLDEKVYNTIAESYTQSCDICGSSPTMMHNLDEMKNLKPKMSLNEYSLSTLHVWIRFLECILDISYKSCIKKCQDLSPEEKSLVEQAKQNVLTKLRSEMDFVVDLPKLKYETTNIENSARFFFRNSKLSSKITGVNEELIKRFYVILSTMTSGYSIDFDAFHAYNLKTSELYIKMYPWHYIPCSIHKILIHGVDIIQSVSLPIGMLSTDALEFRNTVFTDPEKFDIRKMSPAKIIKTFFQHLLVSSDPLITSDSRNPALSFVPLCSAAKALFSKSEEFENLDSDDSDDG